MSCKNYYMPACADRCLAVSPSLRANSDPRGSWRPAYAERLHNIEVQDTECTGFTSRQKHGCLAIQVDPFADTRSFADRGTLVLPTTLLLEAANVFYIYWVAHTFTIKETMSQVIDSLKEAGLNERLFPPEHEQYKESLTSYWANQEVEVKPAYILRPQSASEVARLVKTLTDINVSNNFSTPFAVRSGGHQTWPGSANIKDGLTIDLRALRQIEVNKEKDSVTAGAGCYWEDVYSALDSEGRTLPGARVLNCGVAGLCLGGMIYAS